MARSGTSGRARAVGLIGAFLAFGPSAAAAGQASPDRGWVQTARRPATTAELPKRPLPHARGREFRTLDAYLAYLKTYAGPTDRPWYREVGPGLYRLETGNLRTGAEPQLFTRDALKKRFGFRD